jgi:rhodanese-related sulfurtransferase
MKRQIIAIVMLALMAFTGNAFAYDDVTPSVAAYMVTNEGAFIIDVRTPQEWNWVGHPGENLLEEPEGTYLEGYVLNVAYMVYHEGYSNGDVLIINTQFVKDVERLLNKDDVIITMCRSGKRSVDAALALEAAGFTNVYNMLNGFEGDKNTVTGYRTENGWKVEDLPYNYSGVGDYKD